jgi:hypothetical protein
MFIGMAHDGGFQLTVSLSICHWRQDATQ